MLLSLSFRAFYTIMHPPPTHFLFLQCDVCMRLAFSVISASYNFMLSRTSDILIYDLALPDEKFLVNSSDGVQ